VRPSSKAIASSSLILNSIDFRLLMSVNKPRPTITLPLSLVRVRYEKTQGLCGHLYGQITSPSRASPSVIVISRGHIPMHRLLHPPSTCVRTLSEQGLPIRSCGRMPRYSLSGFVPILNYPISIHNVKPVIEIIHKPAVRNSVKNQ